jgi:hypothetical protein
MRSVSTPAAKPRLGSIPCKQAEQVVTRKGGVPLMGHALFFEIASNFFYEF